MTIFYLFVSHHQIFYYNWKILIHCHILRTQNQFHLNNLTVVLMMKGPLV